MSDTVEVVAKAAFSPPTGAVEADELFTTTRSQARVLATMGLLTTEDGVEDPVEAAVAAGTKARAAMDKREAAEAREREKAEKAEADAARATAREAKAKPADTASASDKA